MKLFALLFVGVAAVEAQRNGRSRGRASVRQANACEAVGMTCCDSITGFDSGTCDNSILAPLNPCCSQFLFQGQPIQPSEACCPPRTNVCCGGVVTVANNQVTEFQSVQCCDGDLQDCVVTDDDVSPVIFQCVGKTDAPTLAPPPTSANPTTSPTSAPTLTPTSSPTVGTNRPTIITTDRPTLATSAPTNPPSITTDSPTVGTNRPTSSTSLRPTLATSAPTDPPSTDSPTVGTNRPTTITTNRPTLTTNRPTGISTAPTPVVSLSPTTTTNRPTLISTGRPTLLTTAPTRSTAPTNGVTSFPTVAPTKSPTEASSPKCSNGYMPVTTLAGESVLCGCNSRCPDNSYCEDGVCCPGLDNRQGNGICSRFDGDCDSCIAESGCQFTGASGCVSLSSSNPASCFSECPTIAAISSVDTGVPGTCRRRCGRIGNIRNLPDANGIYRNEDGEEEEGIEEVDEDDKQFLFFPPFANPRPYQPTARLGPNACSCDTACITTFADCCSDYLDLCAV